ncbi:hypothetical protein ACFLUC_00665 [Chloroflexota bacterium]
MLDRTVLRNIGMVFILVVLCTACSLVSDIGETTGNIEETAHAVETSMQSGRELIETGQAIVTQVQDSELLRTAWAGATQVEESGLLETAKAFTTQEGPSILETAQSIASVQVPILQETLQAMMTRLPTPGDIPVMKGDKSNYIASPEGVSYIIDSEFKAVLEYYEHEMPLNGWDRVDAKSEVRGSAASIFFQKGDRFSIVNLSFNTATNQTMVSITIQDG